MISTGPRSVRTLASASSTAARSATSAAIASAPAPEARSSSAAWLTATASRSRSPTRFPAAASRFATAKPIPAAAPVTTATRLIRVPLRTCAVGTSMEHPRIVRKLTLKKRECNCHWIGTWLGSARPLSEEGGSEEGGPRADRPHDRRGEGAVSRQGRSPRRGCRVGREGRLHLDLGSPGSERLRRARRRSR